MTTAELKAKLTEAMRERKEPDLTVLRGLLSLFTYELTTSGRTPADELSEDEVTALIRRSLKQRKEATEQYRLGNREDLAAKEEAEFAVLAALLPDELDDAAIAAIVEQKKMELGITDKSGMGKLMGAVMREVGSQADGNRVKEAVAKHLA